MRLLFLLPLAAALLAGESGIRLIGGKPIRYEIIDGQAVVGDIILGPAAATADKELLRASSAVAAADLLWPGAVVPYEIDASVPSLSGRIPAALNAWSSTTPARFIPHTTETDYVVFRRGSSGQCSSSVGRIGGRQYVNLGDDCTVAATVHEVGHVLGLWHTQSRQDRDLFIQVNYDSIDYLSWSQFSQALSNGRDLGGYPYDSIMHYGATGFALPGRIAIETIPAGIPIGLRSTLPPCDIDAVQRLYGAPSRVTTITTNPPGATVLVDGAPVATPYSVEWAPGSTHTLAIEDQQSGRSHYRFGRWSDGGARSHSLTASPDVTVYTAHLRRLIPVISGAADPATGAVTLSPAPDATGRVPYGSMLRATATPAAGHVFTNWIGTSTLVPHGSSNPADIAVLSDALDYTAHFTTDPVTTITTSPPGLRILIDGTSYVTPRRFAWMPGSQHTANVSARAQSLLGGYSGHEFLRWDQDEINATAINFTADTEATHTANFSTGYGVQVTPQPTTGGAINVSPSPASGFLPAGTAMTVTAQPRAGYQFGGWAGALAGVEPELRFSLSGPVFATGGFGPSNTLTSAGIVSGASQIAGALAPGQIVTLYGASIGPATPAGLALTAQGRVATELNGTRVLFDGIAAPLIYVSANQINCVVPWGVSQRTGIHVEVAGRLTNTIFATVESAAPAFFTYNSSGGGGGAFVHLDGSVNTAANPVPRGGVLSLYATGTGAFSPAQQDGEVTGAALPSPALPVKVWIYDREAEILYAGPAPGAISGLTQINVRVPADLEPGLVPIVLESGGIRGPRTVSLAIR